jgi:hypothetical protein
MCDRATKELASASVSERALTATTKRQTHRRGLGAGKSTSVVGGDLSRVRGVSQVAAGVHRIAVRLIRKGCLRNGTSSSREADVTGNGSGDAYVGRASSRSNEGDRVQRHFMIYPEKIVLYRFGEMD